jgi:hypothetical protein
MSKVGGGILIFVGGLGVMSGIGRVGSVISERQEVLPNGQSVPLDTAQRLNVIVGTAVLTTVPVALMLWGFNLWNRK